jgi:hypothetical protein
VITEEIVKVAVICGQEGVLKIIEEHFKISLSKEDWSIVQFYNIVKTGKEDIIQKLLVEGIKSDLKNSRYMSPL